MKKDSARRHTAPPLPSWAIPGKSSLQKTSVSMYLTHSTDEHAGLLKEQAALAAATVFKRRGCATRAA